MPTHYLIELTDCVGYVYGYAPWVGSLCSCAW